MIGPRPALLLPLIGLLVAGPLAAVTAQGEYTVEPASVQLGGCIGPSPCDCAGWVVGTVAGTHRLQLLLPPLGPIYEYLVLDLDWLVTTPAGSVAVTGSGTFVVDLISGTQSVELDLVVGGGAPRTFTSLAGSPLAPGYPGHIEFQVFAMVDSCLYDGFSVSSSVPAFRRGDCNLDGGWNIGDAVFALGQLFDPLSPPSACPLACDVNDDGSFDIGDPIALLNHLFGSGAPPAAPYPDCGPDPTPGTLPCAGGTGC